MSDQESFATRFRALTTLENLPPPVFAALLLVNGLLGSAPATAAIAIDSELAYTSDSNVTRAHYDSDIQHDQFFSVGAGANYVQWLNQNHRLIYRGFLRGEKYRHFDKLSHVTAGANFTYQYRASGAFSAPTYGVFAKGAVDEYKSNLRDSTLGTFGVSWRKPITDRVTFTTILSENWRDSDSTVFDTKETSLLLNGDYAWGSRTTIYLTYNYFRGDIVSTSTNPNSPRLKFVDNANAINADDAFGTGAVAYRLDGYTNVATLGMNYKLGEQHSLDFSARYAESHATGGITYNRYLISAAYLARF